MTEAAKRYAMEEMERALELVPHHMRGPVRRYVMRGGYVGDFLRAVLSNNLVEAFVQADDLNAACMREWARALYTYLPRECWGGLDTVSNWQLRGGLEGIALEGFEEGVA